MLQRLIGVVEEEQDFEVHPRYQELQQEIEEEMAAASFLVEGAAAAAFGAVAVLTVAVVEPQSKQIDHVIKLVLAEYNLVLLVAELPLVYFQRMLL